MKDNIFNGSVECGICLSCDWGSLSYIPQTIRCYFFIRFKFDPKRRCFYCKDRNLDDQKTSYQPRLYFSANFPYIHLSAPRL